MKVKEPTWITYEQAVGKLRAVIGEARADTGNATAASAIPKGFPVLLDDIERCLLDTVGEVAWAIEAQLLPACPDAPVRTGDKIEEDSAELSLLRVRRALERLLDAAHAENARQRGAAGRDRPDDAGVLVPAANTLAALAAFRASIEQLAERVEALGSGWAGSGLPQGIQTVGIGYVHRANERIEVAREEAVRATINLPLLRRAVESLMRVTERFMATMAAGGERMTEWLRASLRRLGSAVVATNERFGTLHVAAMRWFHRTNHETASTVAHSTSRSNRATGPDVGSLIREPLDDGGHAPVMTFIPPGQFLMGMNEGEGKDEGVDQDWIDETRPRPLVTFARGFWMARDPVTVGDFRSFRSANPGHDTGSSIFSYEDGKWEDRAGRSWDKPGFAQTDDHPVVGVSWRDAQAYIGWLNEQVGRRVYRLPSESEWEYACRAGTVTARHWGDGWDAMRSNSGETHRGTTPVGTYVANAWHVRDMIGNVWEWTADPWQDNFNEYPTDGSARHANSGGRGLRGGSWSNDSRSARAGFRGRSGSSYRISNVGFRVARALIGATRR